MDHECSEGPVLGRRAVMAAVGFTPLLAMLHRRTSAGGIGAAGAPRAVGPRHFDEHAAAVVTEATARLIPGPLDDPAESSAGAREAGVTGFIDAMLSAFEDDPPRIFAGGPWSDRAGSELDYFESFVPLTPHQQTAWRDRISALQATYREGIAVLDAAAGGDFSTAAPEVQDRVLVEAVDFRRVLFVHAVEGMYCAPEYGGNHDLAGWREIGSAGDVAPRGFTPAEVSESDGPDPAPADVPLPYTPVVAIRQKAIPAGHPSEELAEVVEDLEAFLAAALPGIARSEVGGG